MTSLNSPAKTYAKTNLPEEPNDFIGRERDVADLRRLLETMRAVTLCGPGGIGKTRLALHVSHSLLDAYPDGIWFVELAEVSLDGPPDQVTRKTATVLGVAEEDSRPLAATLADALRPAGALLLLDNCEHLVDECADLTRVLMARCPRLRVLATSREPLRMAGENVWRVPPLEPAEAARLFLARAGAVRPGFPDGEGTAVAEITRALDGVPLALELAAARIRVLSVDQIASRLADRFRLLSAGDRTAPPRQRTLRAAIDWSHELLNEPERVLLRRLSVFQGWTLEQAELVCADDDLDVGSILDLLTALVDKSLVVVAGETAGEVRFRLLDSIRQYAAERLAAAGETAMLRGRHRDAVLEAAERHGEIAIAELPARWRERAALFFRYDAELPNVHAALAWSLEQDEIEEGLRICTAGRTYWIVRGRVTQWSDWSDRFLARAAGLPPSVLGPALAARAQLAVGSRDFAQAGEFAREALEHCRKAGDDFMTAAALIVLAEAHTRAGRVTEAMECLDEADVIAALPGQEWNRAYALTVRGYLQTRRGRLREARELLETGVQIMRDIGQLWGASHALIGLGRLAELRGDLGAARDRYAEAQPILREIEARPELARALAGLGRVALEQGDPRSARESLAASLRLSRTTGIRLDVARALEAFAALVAAEGDDHGSVRLGGAAAALREAAGGPAGTGSRLERTLEPIRKRLGEPLVAQLWGEGRVTSPDEAVAQALRAPAADAVPVPREPEPPTNESAPSTPGSEPRLASEPAAAPTPAVAPAPARPLAAPVTPPTTLTTREREIARLVARGLTNRGIADELVISPATVARHVTNILTKLGFASRAQVAAWAVENIPAE
ncbi:LuxR C-terminal-related transcriptional regulator [Spirillospora sp. NPDC048911]|uniref:LuxR C-terminal-related transcriptional regulator n=1 Tax=Spirillospora sp. NPDC048911 TaxID=3364527 RepID=UPI003710B5DF